MLSSHTSGKGSVCSSAAAVSAVVSATAAGSATSAAVAVGPAEAFAAAVTAAAAAGTAAAASAGQQQWLVDLGSWTSQNRGNNRKRVAVHCSVLAAVVIAAPGDGMAADHAAPLHSCSVRHPLQHVTRLVCS